MTQKVFSNTPNPKINPYNNDPLATPFTINTVTCKNRLVRSATMENMVDTQGKATPAYVDLYNRLALGGIGLIITGHMYVDVNGRSTPGMAGLDRDDQIIPLQKTTEKVHEQGTKIFAQLNHVGFKALHEPTLHKKILAPSKTR